MSKGRADTFMKAAGGHDKPPRGETEGKGEKILGDRDVLWRLDHIMTFQLNDLQNASILAKANFLVAVGSMNTIEFLGGVRTGLLGRKGSKNVSLRFAEGVRLLGTVNDEYSKVGEEKMYNLRNGLTHQYVPSLEGLSHIAVANDWKDDRAIVENGDILVLNVAQLIVDLRMAWRCLRDELQQDSKMLSGAGEALGRLPHLM